MANDNIDKFGIDKDKPADWFEPLYANADLNGEGVPWANMDTHPLFQRWLDMNPLSGNGKTALVVGCGMGDDAIALEALGFDVTAFDVSTTAINYCKQRFPDSKVSFLQADLLKPQPKWRQAFDFVLEIYTVQALPPQYESQLIGAIANFVAPQGTLLVVAEVSDEERRFENGPPWLLTPQHIDAFQAHALSLVSSDNQAGEFDQTTTFVSTFKR
ncbi:class I SAM-dependent methyltransferase [Thalassotalea agarivorans]|uniref:Methyltransferase domain-containing protein n=1 Tax=Thalassotalea agarivorans TaxID=349064 RepID=A0A1I0GDZ7_THASX|nr:class I SAM-dependent methyltransferase [Thalassotalea agarivorans]SET69137.1 Methyltransferase domain-containing protein [Thalassotalea agarivorans]